MTEEHGLTNQKKELPNATATLILGLVSIAGVFFTYGFAGIVCGIVGIVLANKDRKLYQDNPEMYMESSFKSSNTGRTCSIIGISLSVIGYLIVAFIIIS